MDPIVLEIVQESLIAIVREMRANLTRTAYSAVIYEARDFSCVIMDAKGQLLAQAEELDRQLERAGRTDDAWETHYDFHVGLARLTGCGSLVDALHRIHLFLLLQWRVIVHIKDEVATNHAWMVRQILQGDPAVAEAAVRRHITASALLPPDLER